MSCFLLLGILIYFKLQLIIELKVYCKLMKSFNLQINYEPNDNLTENKRMVLQKMKSLIR